MISSHFFLVRPTDTFVHDADFAFAHDAIPLDAFVAAPTSDTCFGHIRYEETPTVGVVTLSPKSSPPGRTLYVTDDWGKGLKGWRLRTYNEALSRGLYVRFSDGPDGSIAAVKLHDRLGNVLKTVDTRGKDEVGVFVIVEAMARGGFTPDTPVSNNKTDLPPEQMLEGNIAQHGPCYTDLSSGRPVTRWR